MALEIESSEIDAIYGELLQLGGPKIAKTMENLGVPASVQRQKLNLACASFAPIPELDRGGRKTLRQLVDETCRIDRRERFLFSRAAMVDVPG